MVKKIVKKAKKAPRPPKINPVSAKVTDYLAKAGVKYELLKHRTVYTAYDAAMTMKRKLSEIAKSLLVQADNDYYLVLLPADYNLNFDKLKKVIAKLTDRPVKTVKIPAEKVIEKALKVKAGALTAFGQLHRVGVIVEKRLLTAKRAVFASGSTNFSVFMSVKDFIGLEKAITGAFGEKKKIKKQIKTKPRRVKKS